MSDPQQKFNQTAQAKVGPDGNIVPYLAYSEDMRSVSEIPNNKGTPQQVYNIQVPPSASQDHSANKLQPALVQNSKLTQSSQKALDKRRHTGQSSNSKLRKEIGRSEPNSLKAGKTEIQHSPNSNRKDGDKIFDLKPPTSMTGTLNSQQIAKQSSIGDQSAGGQGDVPVQNVFQFNLRVNNNSMNGGGVVVEAANESGQTSKPNSQNANSPYKVKQKGSSRRPASSKQRDSRVFPTQMTGTQQISSQGVNPYIVHSRKVIKRRPQSANRKTTQGVVIASMKPNLKADTFKSPGQSFSYKKNHGQASNNTGSAVTQKHRRLLYSQPQNFVPEQLMMTSEMLSDNSGQVNPYTRSIKIAHQFAAPCKTFSSHKAYPQNMFGSPDKVTTKMKHKIPTQTLQSREDLYEQNMHTKVQVNSLRNENRKISTKLQVLENQLAQKDKLFEDMYRAAFSQAKPMSTSSAQQQQMFHPVQQPQFANNTMLTSMGPAQKGPNTIYAQNSNQTSLSNQQQHANAQQLINSYKRTIREQSRELDKRDLEIDQIKRSVKMTQINQLLIESEAYRSECQRLREQLEQVMRQQQLSPSFNEPATSNRNESATDTFKRDTKTTQLMATINDEKDQLQKQNETLLQEKQTLMVRLAQQESESGQKQVQVDQLQKQIERQSNEIQQLNSQLTRLNQQSRSSLNNAEKAVDDIDKLKSSHQQLTSELKSRHDSQTQQLKASLEESHQKAMADLRAELEQNRQAEVSELKASLEESHQKAMADLRVELEQNRQAEVSELKANIHDRYQGEISNLKTQIESYNEKKANLTQRLEKTTSMLTLVQESLEVQSDQNADEAHTEEVNNFEEQLQVQKQRFIELQKQTDQKQIQLNQRTEEIKTLEENNQVLLKRMKSYDHQIQQAMKRAEAKGQELIEIAEENDKLLERVNTLEGAQSPDKVPVSDLEELKQELQFKKNEIEALHFNHKKALKDKDAQIETLVKEGNDKQAQIDALQQQVSLLESAAKNSQLQSPPIPNHQRRSTKMTKNGSAFGDSEFDRAPASESAAGQKQSCDEDRSDLGFTSNEGDKELADAVLGNSNKEENVPKSAKICVNDKTVFGPEGFPLSPKEITEDSPHVKEGFARLLHAMQMKFIRHDSVETLLFGQEYRMEVKLSIRKIKEQAMANLKMTELAAIDWARFLVEHHGVSATSDIVASTNEYIRVEEDKACVQGYKIVNFLQQKISKDLVFFRPDKEEKMKLIVGERLQDKQTKTKLLNVLSQSRSESLSCEQMAEMFNKASLVFNKETLSCCFIFLLKKTDDYYCISKKDLIEFIHQSGAKAHDFTMTGAAFPIETDLAYSSDSDGGNMDMASSAANTPQNPAAKAMQSPALQPAQSAQAPAQQLGNDEEESEDDFGANDTRSEYSGRIPPEVQAVIQNANPPQPESPAPEEEDDFGANDSRSDYSGQISPEIQAQIEGNSGPPTEPAQTLSAKPIETDGFGANDSRSDYSGQIPTKVSEKIDGTVKTKVEEPAFEIPDESSIPVEIAPEKSQLLQVQQTHDTITDSINDRDLESSVNRQTITNSTFVKPLAQVAEAMENQEVASIDIEKSNSLRKTQTVDEPQIQGANVDQKRFSTELAPVQRSQTLQGASGSESNNSETQSQKTKSRRKNLKIDIINPIGQVRKSIPNSNEFTNLTTPQGQVGLINMKPTTQLGDTRESNVSSQGERLLPLKEQKPVPFGITVTQQQHSAYGQSRHDNSPSLDHSQHDDQTPRGSIKASRDEILGQDSPEVTQNARTESAYTNEGGMQYDSIVNGQTDSQFQTVNRKQSGENINETKSFVVEELHTERTEEGYIRPETSIESPVKKSDMELAEKPSVEVIVQETDEDQDGSESKLQDLRQSVPHLGHVSGELNMNIHISPIPPQKQNDYVNVSLPSGSKLVDDSFGQGSYQLSGDKRQQRILPPLELLELKPQKRNPDGIQVGALLTDSSRMPNDSSSMVKQPKPQAQPAVRDFTAADQDSEEDNYEDDEYIKTEEDEIEMLKVQTQPGQQQQLPIAVKKMPAEDEIDDDYEF